MGEYITVRIYRPEGYEDVHSEIVLQDFIDTPDEFPVELLDEEDTQ